MLFEKDLQYGKFSLYGFLKNLRFYEPFLLLILLEQGLSYTQIGVLYAIREVSRNLLEIPAGVFADAFGRRRSMIISFLSYILSFIIFYSAKGFGLFSLAFILYSVGDAFRTGTHKAMILTYLNHKGWQKAKVHYYGHTRSWSQIGSAVSSLAAGAFVLWTGEYRLIFLLSVIPYIINLINLWSYPVYLDGERSAAATPSFKKQFVETGKEFLHSVRNPQILAAVTSMSVYTGYYKAIKDYIQPLIAAFALTAPFLLNWPEKERIAISVALIYFIVNLSTSFSSRHSGQLADRFNNPRRALSLTLGVGALFGLSSGSVALLGWNGAAIILFSGILLVENLRKPIGVGYVSDLLDQKLLASALSVESQAETIFSALFAIVLGMVIDHTSLGTGFVLLAGSLLLAVLVIPKFQKHR